MKLLLGSLVASGVLVAAMAAVIELKNREEAGLRETLAGHVACDTAVTHADLTASAARCSAAVAAVHLTARRAGRCDAALKAGDTFAVEAACTEPIKALIGELGVRTRERDTARVQLSDTRRGQAAAIASAEARGRTQTQRTERVQQDLAAAPRTDSGLGRCDAECLRGLGGAAGAD